MTLVPQIRERRMEKHLTQTELAEIVGIDQTQLSRYEKGKNFPGLEVLIKFEEVLECTLKDLYKYV